MYLIALCLGTLVGLVLALTGAGGGILAVPALTLGLGFSMVQASPVALLTVAAAAATGMMGGVLKGYVRVRAALLISAVGILVAPFGHAHRASGGVAATTSRSKTCVINTKTGRIDWNVESFLKLSLIGVISGMATGLLGVGGGFIVVPALLRCSNISMNGIVATSLMVITLISGGAVIAAFMAGNLQVSRLSLLFIGGAVGGMLLGRRFAEKIPATRLQQTFSILVTGVALALLYKMLL